MTIEATPEVGANEPVFSNLSKVNTGKWAERYLLNPSDIRVSDVRWIWEEVFLEGDASTEHDAFTAAQLLFDEFGGYDKEGRAINRGVFLFLKRFLSEELTEKVVTSIR